MQIQGSFHTKDFSYVSIKIYGCNLEGEGACVDPKSDEFAQVSVEFIQTDTVVNLQNGDRSNIFQQFINSHNYFILMANIRQIENWFFMPSEADLDDDIFKLFDSFDQLHGDKNIKFAEQR